MKKTIITAAFIAIISAASAQVAKDTIRIEETPLNQRITLVREVKEGKSTKYHFELKTDSGKVKTISTDKNSAESYHRMVETGKESANVYVIYNVDAETGERKISKIFVTNK